MSKSRRKQKWGVVISCEHAAHTVPATFAYLFAAAGQSRPSVRDLLRSHRGWDPGAAQLSESFENVFQVTAMRGEYSRLLVELNRSVHHPNLFSEFSKNLSKPQRQQVLDDYYWPYRNRVLAAVESCIHDFGKCLHLSIHTFTPVWHGVLRRADIGLLYDPASRQESKFCQLWQSELKTAAPDLWVRRNYPYRGVADGFTTFLRKKCRQPNDSVYMGVELEVNQKFPVDRKVADWKQLCTTLAKSAQTSLQHFAE